jgi:hypothetical protein
LTPPWRDVGVTVNYPRSWTPAPRTFANAEKLVNVPSGPGGPDITQAARIMITTEVRRSHAEALRRLREIAGEEPVPSTFLVIGGWPGLQRRQLAPRPRPGESEAALGASGDMLVRFTTVVAADRRLVRLEASLPPTRESELAPEIERIGRSLSFRRPGPRTRSEREAEELRASAQRPEPQSHATPPAAAVEGARPASAGGGPGAGQRIVGSASELEVAVTNDGKNVVVATNGGFAYSNNGGKTFIFGGTPSFPGTYAAVDGDPSLAVGRSGTIYYGEIGFPTGSTNATAISVSTNNGQSFSFRSNAVVCPNASTPPAPPVPNACFADQEHIGADRVNPGPGNQDQVYSTWRNFDVTDQDPAIVCSQDGGNTWTAPLNVGSGFVPRITVGQDGFVYVIYRSGGNIMLNKYGQCRNGLGVQPGFPVTVTAVSDVVCPVAGLDRCNDGNILSSHTVAVDDANAAHVYVAYATNTGAGNENVVVRDSTDGGLTFPRSVVVNGGASGRRFMPWVCAVGGTAHVTWYDRRFAVPGSTDDVTDFFRGSAFVSGASLVAGAEVRLTDAGDPECAPGFPCGSRAAGDSDACPAAYQPQLVGQCKINPPPNPDTSSNTPCDFDQTTCPAGEVCTPVGGGCPKYGDYNGDACGAGRIYSAWASATPPTGVTPSGNIDTYFTKDLVCCVPEIQVPPSVTLPDTCAGDTSTAPLHVCNTGIEDLSVSGITSSDPQFTVTGAFPVTIAAAACHDFTVSFKPGSRGPKSANLTISSNDTVNSPSVVPASGLGKGLVSIACPADQTVNNDPGLCSAAVNPGTPTVDAEGCPVTTTGVRSDGKLLSEPYPVGTTTITWTAKDGGNNAQSCVQTIVVKDVEPPVITGASASPNSLWPPNHKMVPVVVNYSVKDNCDGPSAIACSLDVSSDEPVNGTGDGDTAPDWIVVDAHHVQLRSERAGPGDGRIYTIAITCKDTKDNTSSTATQVTVPHSRGH